MRAPGDRYRALMARAAAGDRRAARALLAGGWWPGNPDSSQDLDRVLRNAASTTAAR